MMMTAPWYAVPPVKPERFSQGPNTGRCSKATDSIPHQTGFTKIMLSAPLYPNHSLLVMISNVYFDGLLFDTCLINHTILHYLITHLHCCADIGGRLLDGVSGSNPAGVMDVCLFWVCWRADHSLVKSYEVCVCLSVISERSWPTGAHWGPLGLSSHWTEDCRLWSFSLRIFPTNTWLTAS
jgi:hypothetical protein